VTGITSIYVSEVLMAELFVPGFVRSTGFNQGPGHVGLVALMGCIVARALFAHSPRGRAWMMAADVAALAVMVLAGAKGALLAYVAYLVLRVRLRHALVVLLVLIASLFVLSQADEDLWVLFRLVQFASGAERLEIWTTILEASDQGVLATLFGHGRVGLVADVSIFDSDWVFLYVTHGLIGVAAVLSLVIWIARPLRIQAAGPLRIALVLVLAGLTNPFLTDIKFGALYWAILISLMETYRHEGLRRPG
jgi:hypothetical protein